MKRKKSVESESDSDDESAAAADCSLIVAPPRKCYAAGTHPDDSEIVRLVADGQTWAAITAALGRHVGCRRADNRWHNSLKTSPAGKEAVLEAKEAEKKDKEAKEAKEAAPRLGSLSSAGALVLYQEECAPLSASGTSAFDTCI